MINFLSREAISQEYEKIVTKVDDLSENLKLSLNPARPGQGTYNYAGMLRQGWEWFFEYMQVNQPNAYQAIKKSNPSLLVGERLWKDRLDPSKLHWNANVFLKLNERYIVVHPDVVSSSIENLKEKHPCYLRFLSLPSAIAQSYYSRIDGFEIVSKLPLNSMESRVLPAKISAWARTESVCKKDKKSKEAMRISLSHLADKSSSGIANLENDFRVFLDTREQDNYKPEGDFLIVQEGSTSGRVFHVRDGNFKNIREVKNPTALLDNYVAHVLSLENGVFDFLPYSEIAI